MNRIPFFVTLLLFMYSLHLPAQDLKLWYDTPAKVWEEALPLGNSRLGAMVYGNPAEEEIQLNEETLWGGSPHRNDNKNASGALKEVQDMIFRKSMVKPTNESMRPFSVGHGMPYQTASLHTPFEVQQLAEYYRELDLEKAVATTAIK